jgi:hypothetical protein
MYRRALGKSTNKFIEEFFGAYLEVKSVTTVFDADVEELCDGELCVRVERGSASYIECEEGHVLVAVIDVIHYRNSGFSWPANL